MSTVLQPNVINIRYYNNWSPLCGLLKAYILYAQDFNLCWKKIHKDKTVLMDFFHREGIQMEREENLCRIILANKASVANAVMK